jgi:hypothetical protein
MLQDPLAEALLREDVRPGERVRVESGEDGTLKLRVMAIVASEGD